MRSACTAFALLLAAAATAGAQENAAPRGPLFMLASAGPARAPVVVEAASVAALRRRVRLSLEGVQLTDALAQIARAAGLQVVFADGVVPVTARVHLQAEEITVAAALTDVLLDARVDVVLLPGGSVVLVKRGTWATGSVAGRVTDARTGHGVPGARVSLQGTSLGTVTNDSGGFRIANVPPGSYVVTVRRIGYVPGTKAVTVAADQEVAVDIRLEISASPLDAVVVTGTIAPTEQKALANPISIITASMIQERGITKVSDLFRGDIPGVFTADYGAASHFYGAPVYVRGTTELFDAPTLKTYVDGVEIANSQYLNELDPTMIDHIEIIRGPEASTLYGAQAINGVMQVFTKKGSLDTPPRLTASVGAGRMEGSFGSGVSQEDNVSVAGGTREASYNLGASYRREGSWTPGHYINTYSSYGSLSFRPANSPLQLDVTARLGEQTGRAAGNEATARAVMDGSLRFLGNGLPIQNIFTIPQQGFGVTARYVRAGWQQMLTVGTDRGANGNDAAVVAPTYSSPSDSFTAVYANQTARLTAAYNSAWDVRLSDRLSANVVAGADYWSFQRDGYTDYQTTSTEGQLGNSNVYVSRQRDHSTGVFGQARLGVSDALFFTAGARVDEGPALPADQHHRSTAPRLGASYSFSRGPLSAKLRAGIGSALKPADPDDKQFLQLLSDYWQLPAPNLKPERQTGWDGGIDLYVGTRATLSVTHYHQFAKDLITMIFGDTAGGTITTYQFVNVARVCNSGWELEGRLGLVAGLALKATYTITSSVVDSLAPDDQTGYSVGQDLPGVPHHTGALTLSEAASRLSGEASVSYVGTSVNYDQGHVFQATFPRLGAPDFGGAYAWKTLPAAYRLGVRVSYELTPRLTLFARGENLTNRIVYDQGFIPIDQLGRTTFVGLRWR